MPRYSIALVLFALFALGLPLYGMQQNTQHSPRDVHGCSGECYEEWKARTGGVLQIAAAKAEARASASPAELGKAAYNGCVACHGANGEGGVGPQLAGQAIEAIAGKLIAYKNGETVGPQSNLMWSQAAQLGDADIDNLAAYIATF